MYRDIRFTYLDGLQRDIARPQPPLTGRHLDRRVCKRDAGHYSETYINPTYEPRGSQVRARGSWRASHRSRGT
jgi:hypothetical protein